jgi:hypothetical protein
MLGALTKVASSAASSGALTKFASSAASSGALKGMVSKFDPNTLKSMASKFDPNALKSIASEVYPNQSLDLNVTGQSVTLNARPEKKSYVNGFLSSAKDAASSVKDATSSAQRITTILTNPFNMLNLILEPTKNETEIRELLKFASTNLAAKALLSAKGITINETNIEQIMIVLKNEKFQTFIRSILTDNLHEKIIPYFTHKDHIGSSALLASDLLKGNCDGLNAELIEKIKQFNPTVGTAPVTPTTSGTETQSTSGTDSELTPMEKETSEKVQEDILNEIKTNGADSKFAKELIDGIINGVVNDPSFAEKVAIVMKNTGGAKKTRRKRKQRKTLRKPKPNRNKTKRRK